MDAKEINRYKKFGNNYFTLTTPKETVLCGVLTELPAFSFNTSWTDSPIASMGDELYKIINKPEIEFLAQTTNNANVMRRGGNLTSKVYENAEPISFDLNFRCYPGQPFGDDNDLTTADEWINELKKATTISEDADLSFGKVIRNLKAAAEGAKNNIFGIVDDIKGIIDAKELDDVVDELHKEYKRHGVGLFKKHTGPYGSKRERELLQQYKEALEKQREKKFKMYDKFNQLKANKFEENRTVNSVKNFGSSLFKLRLYPFIFDFPFIVYISSWSVKPSKEYNMAEDQNYYFDFTISCTTDQIMSAKTWTTKYFSLYDEY